VKSVKPSAASRKYALHAWLFFFAIALMPVMQPVVLELHEHTVIAADCLFVLSGIAWLYAIFARGTKVYGSVLQWPACAYLTACIAATIFSREPLTSVSSLAIDFYVVGLAFLTANLLRSEAAWNAFSRAWLAGTAITALAGTAGVALFYFGIRNGNFALSGYGSLPAGPYPRIRGLFLNANMACNYLSVGLLLVLAAMRAGWLNRKMAVALLALITIALWFTLSPGIGGAALGVALWLRARSKSAGRTLRARWANGTGIFIAAFFLWALLPLPNQLEATGIRGLILHPHPSSRVECWATAIHTIHAHPVIGIGPGVNNPCPAFVTPNGEFIELGEAHNTYLNVAALKGIVGLAALLWLFWSLAARLRLSAGHDAASLMTLALSIAFVEGVLYQGLSSSFEHTRHLWVVMGALAASYDRNFNTASRPISGSARTD